MRKTVFITAVLLACAQAVSAQDRPAEMAAAPDARVSVYNPSGSVSVTAWDRNEVAVFASRSSLRDLEMTGDSRHITVRARTGFKLEVRVPKGAKLRVECGSGSIEIVGVEGSVEAESMSGELRIEGTPRSIDANGLSGSVTILGGGTEITRAESTSGSVVVTEARGVVDASSSSGRVRVSGRVRDARLFSVSGAVEFNGTVENRLTAESSSGGVMLRLPASTSAEYEFSTVSGNINNDFGPAATRSRSGAGVSLSFSVGGGAARIKASSVSGSVRLTDR